MKIQVYKCRFTGEIFRLDEKEDYIQHLKELREDMREKRRFNHVRREFESWLAAEKEKICSIEEIAPWILKNQKRIMQACNSGLGPRYSSDSKFDLKTDEFTKITFKIKYSKNVSNYHTC